MTTSLENRAIREKILFLPFPGGQMRFHVCYDERTKVYWLLSSQATDSMTKAGGAPLPDRYNLPNNERHRLVLHFSKTWWTGASPGWWPPEPLPKEARHYASMDIDGDDLVILSRSGDENAKSAHEGNIITFHRVKNFRDLRFIKASHYETQSRSSPPLSPSFCGHLPGGCPGRLQSAGIHHGRTQPVGRNIGAQHHHPT